MHIYIYIYISTAMISTIINAVTLIITTSGVTIVKTSKTIYLILFIFIYLQPEHS